MLSTLTFVSAADINDLKVPGSYERTNETSYSDNATCDDIDLINETDTSKLKIVFANDTDLKMVVNPTQKEHIYLFKYEVTGHVGCVELFEVNNKKYVISLTAGKNLNDSKIEEMAETLEKL